MCRDVPKSQTFAGKQVVNSVKQESDRMTAADNRKKVLQIKAPRTVNTENGVSLCADIVIGGRTETVWFEVNCKYAPFLTDDRLDAFVAACLYRAMMMGADIECEAPVSRRLLYQLNNYLLPVLADNIPEFHVFMSSRTQRILFFQNGTLSQRDGPAVQTVCIRSCRCQGTGLPT